MNRSDQARLAQSKRKTNSGPAKKLAICSHCGELLGVRERRLHGDDEERARQAEYQRKRVQKMDTP